jgi:microcystin-dependent protein
MSTTTTNYDFIKPGVNDPTDEDLWGGMLNDNFDSIDTNLKDVSDVADDALAGILPIASVIPYAGATAPSNFALCYGQAIDRTTYADLFALVGTTYGVGDGATTFNLPDLRGRAVAGKDDMGGVSADRLTDQSGGVDGDVLGDSGGDETHTLVTAEIPSHTHDFNVRTASFGSVEPLGGASGTSAGVTDATGGDGAHNNVQPTFILNYIIKIA